MSACVYPALGFNWDPKCARQPQKCKLRNALQEQQQPAAAAGAAGGGPYGSAMNQVKVSLEASEAATRAAAAASLAGPGEL